MKRKFVEYGLITVIATLLVLPGVCQGALWVGGQIGVNAPLDSTFEVNGVDHGNSSMWASVIGGGTVGYDFVNSGFLAYDWPAWMRYFSFALDFTYNRFNVSSASDGLGFIKPEGSRFEGHETMLSFLFIGHYGFFPDSEVPTGRLNPYLGIGPGIMFSGFDLGAVRRVSGIQGLGSSSATNIALVVESGIRFMALKNVSIDTAVRYRYAAPSYNFGPVSIESNGMNQLAFLMRASYHF
jgi:opacity protein-like surface antigen